MAAQVEATTSLQTSPDQSGQNRTTWTRRLLGQHLWERVGCALSASTLGRLIHRLGFVWRRPKLTLKQTDPQAAERQAAIAEAIAAHPQAPHLYGDECDIHQLPLVRGQWQRRGQQAQVPTPGNNKKQPVFGFLNAQTGQWHYFLHTRKRSVEFLGCLHEIYKLYPVGPILLFLDNASIHKSKVTRRWLSHHERFLVCYLPTYSGHATNPVEKVWWLLKNTCAANCLYPSIEAVQDAVVSFFAQFPPAQALRLIGGAGRATSPQAVSLPGQGDGASLTAHVQAIQDSSVQDNSVSLAKAA